MNLTVFPSFSDRLRQAGIDPIQLIEALEVYQDDIKRFVDLNFNSFEQPIEYLGAMDNKKKVDDFVKLIPRLCPESEKSMPFELIDHEFNTDDYDDEFDD